MTEPPITPDEEDGLLAAEYALGVLQDAAREEFARRVSADPELAAEVRYWDEHFARFTDDVTSVAPPVSIQTQLEHRLFATPQRPSIWISIGLWRGFTFAALTLLVAIVGWNLQSYWIDPTPTLVARVAGEGRPLDLVATYDEKTGELNLNRTTGTPVANRSFELWLIVGAEPPVSLGVLPLENVARLAVPPALRTKLKGSVLAVTEEPAGGSPTGAPTGPVVGKGQLG